MSQFFKFSISDQMNNYSWEVDMYNDLVLFVEFLIICLIVICLYICCFSLWRKNFEEWEILEIIWSIIPAMILIFFAYPTIKTLYYMENLEFNNILSLKINAHQWYWEYSFPEFKVKFDSYPLIISKIFRLLETSQTLLLPHSTNIWISLTSSDVIHSWTIPNMGLKMDSCPGRLNFFMINIMKPGIYVGQCSELCGSFHHFMPIYLESSSLLSFQEWLKTKM